MALSTKDIYSLIKEFNEYGATIYYLLQTKKIKLDDIANILFKDDIEQVNLIFPKFIMNIDVSDIDKSYDKYKKEFTKLSCIDKIIEKNGDKYQHLREIRNVVNLEEIIDDMIKDRTYKMSLNLHYSALILKDIENSKKKSFISIREKLKLYQNALDLLMDENEVKISNNIDSYYISTITR